MSAASDASLEGTDLHIDLVCWSSGVVDGIRDYTLRLEQALKARPDTTARAVDLRDYREPRDLVAVLRTDVPAGAEHVLLLEYNPFSFSRRGVAWWLPKSLAILRRRHPRVRVMVLVHELWLTIDSLRNGLVGLPQRLVFLQLRSQCDLVAVSTDSLVVPARRLSRRSILVLPVGSNLPDERSTRAAMRAQHNISDEQRVVTAFGTGHPSRLLGHLQRAMEVISESYPGTVAVSLGASAPPIFEGMSPVRVLSPGRVADVGLARYLAMTDLLLLPFSDGVSTRRTTVMAGLQHGIPILGTDGVSTSAELRDSGALALVDSDTSADIYAERARILLPDRAERERLGLAGRSLFERRFAWPVIARELVITIGESGPGSAAVESSTRLA